ncbi:hypothetical protein WR25_04317 isoform A [Diploscapter pachys]|uniref:Apple domain-containing protein n=1 Tax=Diploscapter pachys TaxID=2018661 RepID=A0A2A2JIY3_9BILA|nr:hypothetical protein WR25_04317 isoform A [Diploscapter pachys]
MDIPSTSSYDQPASMPHSISRISPSRNDQRKTDTTISTLNLIICRLIILFSTISLANGRAHCIKTESGLHIAGSNYRRIKHLSHAQCASECRDDDSCLAYEWIEPKSLCFLKSRSLSGDIESKEGSHVGFCYDDEDEVRDRFRDHVIMGPILSKAEDIDGEHCKKFCSRTPEASFYSWSPKEIDTNEVEDQLQRLIRSKNTEEGEYDEEEITVLGTCTCMSVLNGMTLQYDSFSGFIPPRQHQRSKFLRV